METVFQERDGSFVFRCRNSVGTAEVGNGAMEESVETEDRERVREGVQASLDDQHSVMILRRA